MRRDFFAFFILTVIAFLLYGHTLTYPFVFDDDLQIVKNEFVQFSDWLSIFSGSSFGSYGKTQAAGIYYKPLMTSAYAVLWKIGNGNSFAFHLFQLILGIANAFLVFKFISKWVIAPIALAAAAIFLIHPMNSEVLLYIADLQDTLYFFWGFLALYLTQKRSSVFWVLLCLLASVFSKESGILFVFIVPIYTFLFQKDDFKKTVVIGSACLITYIFIRFYILEMTTLSYQMVPIANLNFFDRVLHFPKVYLHYLQTFFWPAKISLHQLWILKNYSVPDFLLPCLVIVVSFFLAALAFVKAHAPFRNYFIFFLCVFLLNMGLHSNILIPLDATVADRWFYLGSFSLLGVVTVLAHIFLNTKKSKFIFATAFLFLFSLLLARSYNRSLDWQSGLKLLSEAYETSPYDPAYADALGGEYYKNGNFEKAEFFFKRSAELEPNEWSAWNNLGTIEMRKGNVALAESFYLKSIQNDKYSGAVVNYARLLVKQQRWEDLKKFLPQALQNLPKSAELLAIRATLTNLNL